MKLLKFLILSGFFGLVVLGIVIGYIASTVSNSLIYWLLIVISLFPIWFGVCGLLILSKTLE